MIDIHTHILPQIDDGAKNVNVTFDMIKEAANAGFTDIITTSHYMEGVYEINKYNRECIIEALQNKLNEEKIDVTLYNGAESYISEKTAELYNNSTIPTLAKSKYILFELPMQSKILYLDATIDSLIKSDYIPILAHPERYQIVQDNIKIVNNWIEKGVLLQGNYGSLIGQYGKEEKTVLTQLLKENKITFLGTDSHRQKSTYTNMKDILKELEKIVGKKKIETLTVENPKCIIDNVIIE